MSIMNEAFVLKEVDLKKKKLNTFLKLIFFILFYFHITAVDAVGACLVTHRFIPHDSVLIMTVFLLLLRTRVHQEIKILLLF